MSDVVRIMCPALNCRRVLSVPIAARGKVVRCPGCRKRLRVPQAREADAPAGTDTAAQTPAGN